MGLHIENGARSKFDFQNVLKIDFQNDRDKMKREEKATFYAYFDSL